MLVDPIGDAHLLRQLDTIPIKVFSYLFNGTIPQSEATVRAATPRYKSGGTVPWDNDRLINKVSGIMRAFIIYSTRRKSCASIEPLASLVPAKSLIFWTPSLSV